MQLNHLLMAEDFEWNMKWSTSPNFQCECITLVFVDVEDDYMFVS